MPDVIPYPYCSRPQYRSPAERAEFAALVIKYGAVTEKGLDGRIERAASLVFLRHGGRLIGTAAIKNPKVSHRAKVSRNAGIELPAKLVPYELGWVVVENEFRKQRLSHSLTTCALDTIGDRGVFATARADNEAMHRTLKHFGFASQGKNYPSDEGDYELKLFLRS